ncbi:hypothetical protein [Flavobacterium sp. NKUCC04_CG]|uniref:hypothetical protein n=1 Tax=Flavobacterium sp. NKUCC04_CG TaxID=2842121 RepID=UPI001C5A997C|nr:hypothetical protein [Flavobacterium sp. NKUCC04_CG]MBW3520420.1 hypothetical protein [Flavobacterium sp. NKUCC04_CG]
MVRGTRSIRLRQVPKFIKIQSTGNQFQGASPATITLLATHLGIVANTYQWFRGTTLVGTNQSFIIANNQVSQIETFKVIVTATDGIVYEESISITKVLSGSQGRPGAIPIQREWRTGETHRNNVDVIDYIYHRATTSWWRLKDGNDNVVAQINPTNQYVQLNSLEQLAVQLIVAEEANLAGFIFKENRLVSQNPSPTNPNLVLDGINGKINAKAGTIGEFEINTGLEYENLTPPSTETQNIALLKLFKFNKEGFVIRDRNIYSGVWCKEIGGIDYCIQGTNHIVDFQVSTGDSSHYLRVKGEGVYSGQNFKGALWVTSPSSQMPAIFIDKGKIRIENGGIDLLKGYLKIGNGGISVNGNDGVTGSFLVGDRQISVNNGIIVGL